MNKPLEWGLFITTNLQFYTSHKEVKMQIQNISANTVNIGYNVLLAGATITVDINTAASISASLAQEIDSAVTSGYITIVPGSEGPTYTTQRPGPVQTFAWTVAAIPTGTVASIVVAWSSAKMGDLVIPSALTDIGLLGLDANVSSAGNVRFQLANSSGATITTGAITVRGMLVH